MVRKVMIAGMEATIRGRAQDEEEDLVWTDRNPANDTMGWMYRGDDSGHMEVFYNPDRHEFSDIWKDVAMAISSLRFMRGVG